MTENFAPTATQKIALAAGVVIAAGWLAYFVFAPTIGFNLLHSWHDEQRALQIVLLLSTTLAYLWLSLVIPAVRAPSFLWVVFALGALSAVLSAFPSYAVTEIALLVQLVILGAFAATFAHHYPRETSLSILYAAWLIGAVYIVGVAANFAGVVGEKRNVDLQVFVLGYANPRFASALHALILPLLAHLALDRSVRPALRNSSWGIATILWTINLVMGTRAIWAAFFVAGVALWWFGAAAGRRALKAVMTSAAAGAFIYLLALLLAPSWVQVQGSLQSRMGDLGNSSARFDLWRAASEVIIAHPLTGIGPMHFANLHEVAGAHPHNWVLQIAAEWGLPTLAIFVIGVYRWMQELRMAVSSRAIEPGGDALPAIALSMVAAVAYGLVDGNWVMPVSQSFSVILAGVSVGLLPNRIPLQTRKIFNAPDIAVIVIVLATGSMLGAYTYRSAGLQEQIDNDFTLRTHGLYLCPRFWQQGYIPDEPTE